MPVKRVSTKSVPVKRPKGYWPRGKRRGDASPARFALVGQLARWHRAGWSYRRIGDDLGVAPTTVRKWILGIDYPLPENLALIEQWLNS